MPREDSLPSLSSQQSQIPPTQTQTLISPSSIIGDGGLLSGDPCGPPCFLGIIVGQTHYTDAEKILTNWGLLDYCSVIDNYEFAKQENKGGWWCSGFGIDFDRTSGIVSELSYGLNPPVELQVIIARYGTPDAISIVNFGGEDVGPVLRGKLLYFGTRMKLVSSTGQERWEYEITPTMLIDVVVYQDEEHFAEEIDSLKYFGHPWRGYGTYPLYERRK
ncbi:MAG: hypothetical protein ACK8QZ_01810 [Anaerolineales bacterium]